MITFDEPKLLARLVKLAPLQRVRFAYNCTGRLLAKDYLAQYAISLKSLQKALDLVKLTLEGGQINKEECQRSLAECETLLPEVEETNDIEETVMATMYTLRCLISDGDTQEAVYAARCAYNEADHLAQNILDIDLNLPGAEPQLLALPIIQIELAAQERDLAEMENL